MEDKTISSQLPGFRFHPTEEELLNSYLRSVVSGKKQHFDVIGFLNIYRHEPRDLPGLAKIGEREWYFFVPRDRKPSNGGRPNRTTQHGFWKATGSDKKVFALSDPKRVIGFKKTLVFYEGRAPRGTKTDWVMNEFSLVDNHNLPKQQDVLVLCKVYRKATSLKVLEQMAAKEEEEYQEQQLQHQDEAALMLQEPTTPSAFSSASSSYDHTTLNTPKQEGIEDIDQQQLIYHKTEADNKNTSGNQLKMWSSSSNSLLLPLGSTGMPELQLPNLNWAHNIFGNSQQQSPFLDILALLTSSPSCSLLNI